MRAIELDAFVIVLLGDRGMSQPLVECWRSCLTSQCAPNEGPLSPPKTKPWMALIAGMAKKRETFYFETDNWHLQPPSPHNSTHPKAKPVSAFVQ